MGVLLKYWDVLLAFQGRGTVMPTNTAAVIPRGAPLQHKMGESNVTQLHAFFILSETLPAPDLSEYRAQILLQETEWWDVDPEFCWRSAT